MSILYYIIIYNIIISYIKQYYILQYYYNNIINAHKITKGVGACASSY